MNAPPLRERALLQHRAAERHLARVVALLPARNAPQVIDVEEMVEAVHDLSAAMAHTLMWLRRLQDEEREG